jgi:hypothetical protein
VTGWVAPTNGQVRTKRKLSLFSKLAVRKQKRRDYVQRLIDPGHADNWPSEPIGTLDHIIILST